MLYFLDCIIDICEKKIIYKINLICLLSISGHCLYDVYLLLIKCKDFTNIFSVKMHTKGTSNEYNII